MYFAYEESANQILRNMRSIGVDLERRVKKGLLIFHATRPAVYRLEMHIINMYDLVREYQPQVVVLDPITDFAMMGSHLLTNKRIKIGEMELVHRNIDPSLQQS